MLLLTLPSACTLYPGFLGQAQAKHWSVPCSGCIYFIIFVLFITVYLSMCLFVHPYIFFLFAFLSWLLCGCFGLCHSYFYS